MHMVSEPEKVNYCVFQLSAVKFQILHFLVQPPVFAFTMHYAFVTNFKLSSVLSFIYYILPTLYTIILRISLPTRLPFLEIFVILTYCGLTTYKV